MPRGARRCLRERAFFTWIEKQLERHPGWKRGEIVEVRMDDADLTALCAAIAEYMQRGWEVMFHSRTYLCLCLRRPNVLPWPIRNAG